jgi:UDP-N-acetylmuramyl pentapeptide synthase
MSAVVGRGFGGDPVGRMVGLEGPDEACAIIGDLIESGDTVLVKGSRLMGLERVVSAIETRWSVAMRPVH